jgi:hypothetical protein
VAVALAQAVHPALAWLLHAWRSMRAGRPQPLSAHRADRRCPDARRPARRAPLTARIVSRDTADADAEALARAACESALENGNDAIFGALFWFLIGGAPAVIVFRLANTLDAMWGYRTPRWLMFGWAAARIDDVLNLVPARPRCPTHARRHGAGAALLAHPGTRVVEPQCRSGDGSRRRRRGRGPGRRRALSRRVGRATAARRRRRAGGHTSVPACGWCSARCGCGSVWRC